MSVPDLVGKDEAVARADLTKAGLRPDVEKVADDAPVGEVVSQDPGTGASVPTGDTVVIEVSAGPDDVGVPSIIGMSRSEAKSALEAQGLTLGTVTEEDSPDQAANRVISTDPGVAEQVAKGSSVDIVVASGDVQLKDYTCLLYTSPSPRD